MLVKAKNIRNGNIAVVSEAHLANSEILVRATDEDIAAEREAKEIKVFGAPLDGEAKVPSIEPTPNKSWTRKQLIALANHRKIEVDSSITKAELLAALTDSEGANNGE